MKKIKLLFLISLFITIFSCVTGLDYSYKFEPIYIDVEKIKNEITLLPKKEAFEIEKAYEYKNYLFVTEKNAGLHIIDNKNVRNPINKAFLRIPFNENISIKDDVLYADSLDKLIAIDISKIEDNKIEILNKLNYPTKISFENNRIKIGYKKLDIVYSTKFFVPFNPYNNLPSETSVVSSSNPVSVGKGGSLSRFSIVDDYLYTVDDYNLNLFNIQDSKNITSMGYVKVSDVKDIETIYPYQDKLFMGATTGTYIYDNKNPLEPSLITKVEHIKTTDPVVVEGTKAYVTLKFQNSLNIVDISDIKKSKVIQSYILQRPSGLAVKENKLFVCIENGLKVLDVKDIEKINPILFYEVKDVIDIFISKNNYAILTSPKGVYQLDISNSEKHIAELGRFEVKNSNITFDNMIYNQISSNDDIKNYIQEGKDTYYYKWYKEYFDDIK